MALSNSYHNEIQERTRKKVYESIDEILDNVEGTIDPDEYPKVELTPEGSHFLHNSIIRIGHGEGLRGIAEESSHFIRSKLKEGEKYKSEVEEFFGALGPIICGYNISPWVCDPTKTRERLERLEKKKKEAYEDPLKNTEKLFELSKKIREAQNDLDHLKGYSYAVLVGEELLEERPDIYTLPDEKVKDMIDRKIRLNPNEGLLKALPKKATKGYTLKDKI